MKAVSSTRSVLLWRRARSLWIPWPGGPGKSAWLVACAVLLGGALRLAQISAKFSEPLQPGDAAEYFNMGLGLRETGMLLSPYDHRPTASRGILYPTFIAMTTRAAPPWGPDGVRLAQAVLGTLCIVLVYMLGTRLRSQACGIFAAFVLALNSPAVGSVSELYIECFFSLLILLVAIALVEWARNSDKPTKGFVALWTGISLTCRSTLFALPAVLALKTAWRGRAGWEKGVFIFFFAYAVSAPWALRNIRHFRVFIPFEMHAATVNLYTASLGIIENVSNNAAYRMAKKVEPQWDLMSQDERNSRLLATAVGNISANPLGYAWTCAIRVMFLCVKLSGLLGLPCSILLLVGLSTAPRHPAVAALGVLLTYWIGMHSFMSASARYLLPVLPVAMVLAGAGVCAILGRLGIDGAFLSSQDSGCGRGILYGARGLVLALYFAGLGFMAHEVWSLPAGMPIHPMSTRYADRGVARAMAGDLDGAARNLSEAIRHDFYNGGAHLGLCSVFLRQGRLTSALRSCGWAVEIGGKGADRLLSGFLSDALMTRARVLEKMGRGRDAAQDMRLALSVAPAVRP